MEYVSDLTVNLGIILVGLILGYGFGRIAEKRHYRSILRREATFNDLIMVTTRTLPESAVPPTTQMVLGNVVISVDYFKRFVAGLRMIFGGRVHTYESLVDRGRREALLRMQERAKELGAKMIFNVRLETSSISKGARRSVGSVEILAYGTAIIP